MYDKWNVRKNESYLKIHVAVNIKAKEIILDLEVADKKVRDGKIMRKLFNQVLDIPDENKVKIKSAYAD